MCAFLACNSTFGGTIDWTAVTEYPGTTMPGVGLTMFAVELSDLSAGTMTVKTTYDSPLSAMFALNAVKENHIKIGDVHGGPLGAIEPIFGLVSLPFLTASVDDTQCLQGATRDLYKAYFAKLGVHLLYSAPWPATGLWSATPAQTLSDIRKLHVRTYDETAASFLKSVGVDAVHMPMSKALPLLATGEITGVMSSGDGGAGQRLWEHLPYFVELNYAAPLSFAVLNQSAYANLNESERHQVDEAARRTEQRLWLVMEDRYSKNYKAMRQHNVTIQKMMPTLDAELRSASQRAIKEWSAKAGADGEELLRRYEALRPIANRRHDATVCSM